MYKGSLIYGISDYFRSTVWIILYLFEMNVRFKYDMFLHYYNYYYYPRSQHICQICNDIFALLKPDKIKKNRWDNLIINMTYAIIHKICRISVYNFTRQPFCSSPISSSVSFPMLFTKPPHYRQVRLEDVFKAETLTYTREHFS